MFNLTWKVRKILVIKKWQQYVPFLQKNFRFASERTILARSEKVFRKNPIKRVQLVILPYVELAPKLTKIQTYFYLFGSGQLPQKLITSALIIPQACAGWNYMFIYIQLEKFNISMIKSIHVYLFGIRKSKTQHQSSEKYVYIFC